MNASRLCQDHCSPPVNRATLRLAVSYVEGRGLLPVVELRETRLYTSPTVHGLASLGRPNAVRAQPLPFVEDET
jgi:hypothetical protein